MTDVASLISNQNSQIVNAQAQMGAEFAQVGAISDAITKAAQSAGTDEQTINTQQAQGLLAAQDAARKVASSYGGNPDDVSFVMTQLGQQWMDTTQQQIQAEKVVQAKQSVSFLDDPLQWFSNKLTINSDISNYNNLEEQANTEYTALSRINTLNTQTADSMKAIAQTQTAATVAATSDLAAQKATIASKQAALQGILYNVKGIQDVTAMGQEQVSNSVAGANLAISAGHLSVAQAQLGIAEKEAGMRAQALQMEIDSKKGDVAFNQTLADQTNAGRASMGLAPLPPVKILSMFKIGGEAGEALKQQYTAGALTVATGKTLIASNPGTAARYLATSASPLTTTNPAVKSVVNVLETAYTQARNPQNAPALGINLKDINSVDNGVSTLVGQQVTTMAANIKPNDHSNIYQAPPLASLASMKSMQDNPLYQSVLKPQIAAGMTETDPVKLLQLTSAAVQAKQINLQDAAAGLAGIFQSAVTMNTATKDYMRFGIAPQTSYITTLPNANESLLGSVFGSSSARVDMTNKAAVTTALMRYMNSVHYNAGSIYGTAQGNK